MTRIARVSLRRVRLPLVRQFQTSSHAKRFLERLMGMMWRRTEGIDDQCADSL